MFHEELSCNVALWTNILDLKLKHTVGKIATTFVPANRAFVQPWECAAPKS
jgi:hypothetical protein